MHDSRDTESATFGALADPSRRAVLRLLSEHSELTASEIAAAFHHIGRTAVSTHLRILRQAGLVQERRQGRFRLYSLRTRPVQEAADVLARLVHTHRHQPHHRVEQRIRLTGG
ncbi:helix-turn-helix transcriptional regulator [Kutzneria buriramensis]|uniref:DNA-binding transcriptional ArsR family regulator n=1 Tax=Kutzneria buriramensis TaxID=1045776 RepID=A0A3E0GVP0_9PSEU|nr:metalloregulator ArsR/SmtB family transcription factor [Kutzneria buriramensis]REH30751.1 DNA-binding transcriptional ArsR family regulator [Kutzneria buriramensis]